MMPRLSEREELCFVAGLGAGFVFGAAVMGVLVFYIC